MRTYVCFIEVGIQAEEDDMRARLAGPMSFLAVVGPDVCMATSTLVVHLVSTIVMSRLSSAIALFEFVGKPSADVYRIE